LQGFGVFKVEDPSTVMIESDLIQNQEIFEQEIGDLDFLVSIAFDDLKIVLEEPLANLTCNKAVDRLIETGADKQTVYLKPVELEMIGRAAPGIS
jgi:hypothetical protein